MSDPNTRNGHVYLIGAGPGDPELITLRGAEALGGCDTVLYDGLSNPALLRHAPQAQHICVGKHGQSRIWKQHEIIAEMLGHAQKGLKVARLKGGDPAVFARTAEEVEALIAAQIPYEIIPGITAALAAGSYAGIPITHRQLASAVALVTGHEEPGKLESALDWNALARFPGTLVIYMGVTTAKLWTESLLEAGKPADTPAAIIRRCSHPDQQIVHCSLADIAGQLAANKMRPPVIVILGPVTELATAMDWIHKKPLFGQSVLVTRPRDQADSLARLLRDQGATVLLQPAIEIGPPDDWSPVDTAIARLRRFEVVVFCSRNGVRYFMDRIVTSAGDLRQFGDSQIAVVGSQTAQALSDYHLKADIVPQDYRAESLAHQLATDASQKQILIVRASRGQDVLANKLTQAGATVTQVVAYSHKDVTHASAEVLELANESKIDWVTVSSSATARNLFNLFGNALQQTKLASLSPVTSQSLSQLGLRVAAEASPYTMQGLVDAIVQQTD